MHRHVVALWQFISLLQDAMVDGGAGRTRPIDRCDTCMTEHYMTLSFSATDWTGLVSCLVFIL